MPTAAIAGVFTGTNQSGTPHFTGVASSQRVSKLDKTLMYYQGLFNKLSSARVFRSGAADATLILFGKLLGAVDLGSYNGSFLQVTVRAGSGQPLDVNRLSTFGFDNKAQSLMLVAARRNPSEMRLSFRSLFLQPWKNAIDAKLASTQAGRNGDPILTWDLFPVNVSFLQSSRQYLKIHQRLKVVFSGWPDYEASMTYHIFLFVNGAGNLRASVDRGAVWVEAGIKSGGISDELVPKAKKGMEELQSTLDSALAGLDGSGFSDVYYLPGNQVARAQTGVMTGTTLDDITIVVD